MLENFGNPTASDLVMGRSSSLSNATGDLVMGNSNSTPSDLVMAKTTSIKQNLLPNSNG